MTENERVEKNIPLVHHIIRNKMRIANGDYDDAFQDGCVGLLNAIRTFDPERGIAFSTYAGACIQNAIKGRRRRQHLPPRGNEGDAVSSVSDPFEAVNAKMLIDAAREVDDLGVIDLIDAGLTQTEVGETLGCGQSVVSRRMRKIRKAIKDGSGDS